MENNYLTPLEIAEKYVTIGAKKAYQPFIKLFPLSILAGAFIALASQGSNVAIHTIGSIGLAKALAGLLFSTGLIMVIITGAELFTGNTLIIVSCLDKKVSWSQMLRKWLIVYIGNFIGSIIVVYFIYKSGQLNTSDSLLGGFTIKTAVNKVSYEFGHAFFMGILCNWLVCMAVWMSAAAKDITGKIWAIFFPIWLFITSGFEHSVANMYYIPIGIFAKSNSNWVQAAISMGIAQEKLDSLNWANMIIKNLLPVTLGNIIGGAIFVGAFYWFSFLFKKDE
ncbi:MAG TPA: formate/nitrite transporter family protein [Clostridiaceae bacterium]|nr:formate/nitrite transporter family protein [Clostridiaceae bacterium]